ncbi:hypothetical protein MLD38_031194 [Melastoma candidum]|uniref:Uncharacterized protein n=1 Tax=Melastoma candidum TaxID=119954 RepID=A0ACB9MPH5_9MYRT|nr:hypothetical protein MLD38_031194 [Melastoma candidum]
MSLRPQTPFSPCYCFTCFSEFGTCSSQMKMIVLQQDSLLLALLLLLLLLDSALAYASSYNCNHTCRVGEFAKHVDYPFGFSPGCKIPLNCTPDYGITIGDFRIVNFTSSSLFVHVPAVCNRSVEVALPLFGNFYAPMWTNAFLFQDCLKNRTLGGCLVPSSFVYERLYSGSCSKVNVSCFSQDKRSNGMLDVVGPEVLSGSGCKHFVSGIAVVDPDIGSLELQTLELGWWVNGSCEVCSLNATCSRILVSNSTFGYRCSCGDGFVGNGFINGGGCQPVSSCHSFDFSGKCGHGAILGILIGGVVIGALLMAIISFVCYFERCRSATSENHLSARRLLNEAAGNKNIPLYEYKDIERSTEGFSERLRLGTGAYGTVYAGRLPNNELVAIKRIKHRDGDSIDNVMNEVKLLSNVSHPNLVRLLGCCIENGEQILVYEFMPNGTLSQHLQRERGRKGLPWTIRLNIAAETASAISYLHSAVNPPIYHRDIKSSNILLDFQYRSKVADFGLSRLGTSGIDDLSHISTAPQGTPGYVDPQYHQNYHLSDKSDVYSFGVVLMEIISGQKAVDFSRPHSEVNLAALAVDRIGRGCLDELIDPFLEPNRDAWTLSSIHRVSELAFRCLAFNKDIRPSMIEVAEELNEIRLSGWAPLDENVIGASSVASTCSSAYNGSETISFSRKKLEGSKKLAVLQRGGTPGKEIEVTKMEHSPSSVQEPWLSEQSSPPSTTSLLCNAIQPF